MATGAAGEPGLGGHVRAQERGRSGDLRASPAGAAQSEHLPKAGFLLLALLALFWGNNWPMMKLALMELPPLSFRTVCVLGGGLGILLIAHLKGHSLKVPIGQRAPLFLCATLNITGWQLLTAFGISIMPAGHAVTIAFTMPLWAAILAVPVLGERLSPQKVLGLALGLAGLAVLIWQDVADLGQAPLGAVFILFAAISWGSGTVAIKRFQWTPSTTVVTGWQLIVGGLPIVAGALLLELDDLATREIGWVTIGALTYIVLVPMIICHLAWYTVVRLFPAAIAALGTLAIPMVGVVSSSVILGEALGWREIVSLALVCSGLAVVMIFPGLVRGLRA
jgi:drug/metabolite transporter (DMT)-like permease